MMRAYQRWVPVGPSRLFGILLVALALAGCAGQFVPENHGTVTPATLARMQADHMERPAPILIRIFKEERILEVWKQDSAGRFRLLISYPICHFSGGLGPKKEFGDRQAPEGFYEVGAAQMNPHSREYLAFNIGYPNQYDRSLGRSGDSLMVHGGCRSVGCYAMTDQLIDEIYGLAYEALAGGQVRFQVQAFPFRMTDANMLAHAADPNFEFWSDLKRGSDIFDATGRPPRVAVCNQRYVFGPASMTGSSDTGALCTGQFVSDASAGRAAPQTPSRF